jgi:regulation of enolase protein 1 (concanavalin A-like superfamily)
MKRFPLLIVAAAYLLGCGSPPPEKNSVESKRSSTPSANSRIAASEPTPAVIETMPEGQKIVLPETVKAVDKRFEGGWQWIDPDGQNNPTPFEFKQGKFAMRIPSAKDLYGENLTAPRLVKAVVGDFQIEARVNFDPTEDYQGAGLLIYVDRMNYLRLERSFGGLREGGSGIRLDVRKQDQYESLTTPGEVPTTARSVELKISRRGNVFTAYWRQNENAEWREVEEFVSAFPDTVLAGVIGCNTAAEIAVEFTNIRLLPQPVTNPLR